jgi:4-hydroxy 2-oxovalerate aldolase
MSRIQLLDCTLRDGGYINEWDFGRETIDSIVQRLLESNVDLIEIGFLRNCIYSDSKTVFNTVKEIKNVLPNNRRNTKFVAMALHNKFDVGKLEENDGTTIDAVRVTFHDYDIDDGLFFCHKVIKKGYQVFINPINLMGYSDVELLKLIDKVNELRPSGFSIVDTFGSMTKSDIVRIYALIENNLNKDITIGLHLHENMLLANSLAQNFLDQLAPNRNCVIDASLFGIGRPPGNLCMELMMDFLNKNYGTAYQTDSILDAIEEHIIPLKKIEDWGYSTEYFLSAKYNLHRNYAEFLQKKGKLTAKSINHLLGQIEVEKKTCYDEKYINELYINYQNNSINDGKVIGELKKQFEGRKIILLAPGTTIKTYADKINNYIVEEDALVVSANFIYDDIKVNYAFFSNMKRLHEYIRVNNAEKYDYKKLIITSNLEQSDNYQYIVDYFNLATMNGEFCDNCGVMFLNLLKLLNVSKVFLAGFDGYSTENYNYAEGCFPEFGKSARQENEEMSNKFKLIRKVIPMDFITPSLYKL